MALSALFAEGMRYVPSLVSAFTSNRRTSAERRQQELLNQQLELQRQAFDPNSPLFQQQLAIESANSQRNIARMVEEFTRNQRRNVRMGRNPLLDPERADEQLARFQTSEAANAAALAPDRARSNILAMAEGRGNIAGSYSNLMQPQATRMQNRSDIYTGIARGIFNPEPRIQQAAPEQPVTAAQAMQGQQNDRTSGGMNLANLPFLEALQRSVSRPFQGK